MIFRKLKRVWSHNQYCYIPKFQETFPELRNVSYEDMCDRWRSLKIDFYTEEKTEAKWWVRLTLPIAFTLYILMFMWIPFLYIFTGKWGYSLGHNSRVLNWFRSLGIS